MDQGPGAFFLDETTTSRVPQPGPALARLFAAPMRPGALRWIGLRPARRAPVQAVERALLVPGTGLEGDRYAGTGRAGRQVTLIAAEDLAAVGAFLGRAVAPEEVRRNLLVAGVNLHALKGRRFRIGAALLEWSAECHPCSRMEEALGVGGYNALRMRGGICARVLVGGAIACGDVVEAA
ncbi:MOSC domain-containing protein [Roseococcus sp. DSY-14]|uniref:MOSC domain-containing protein n=1 Tax=Roseococcus sp. DSY-14 TaxID=3369650 RepID=UPI00387AF763